MNRLDRQNSLACIIPQPLALIIGAGAVTCFGLLLMVAPARSDWWPYSTASASFSLKIKVFGYERSPAGDLWEVETQAQRADGATVIVDTLYRPHMPPDAFRQVRLPDGTIVRLVDAVSAKFTCRPKHLEVAPARRTLFSKPAPPDCLGASDTLLGQTVLFGQPVDVVETWDLGSAGQRWVAPALGCKELQWQNATLRPDGSRRIELEGKLVSFTLGEPDPRLFDLGPSYAEVKLPSDLLRREMKAAGVPWIPELAEAGEQEDQHFALACQEPATPPQ
jgi:hypothetical protein